MPFTSYGYTGVISGDGYTFRVDTDMDSWLCPDGKLMPINTAKLYLKGTPIEFTSFTILDAHHVQVNSLTRHKANEYFCHVYDLEDLYFVGETYSEDE